MNQLKCVGAATALALTVGHPAWAARKNTAGQPAKYPPKPSAQVTKIGQKPCLLAGKPDPCKARTHPTAPTAPTARLSYKF